MKNYSNVTIFDHPLIKHKIAIIRDEKTSMKDFREIIEEITTLMTYESLREGVPTIEVEVKTPLETCTQQMIDDEGIVIVPILRAGLGMVNGIHTLFPCAKVGHIGLYRNEETLEPQEYYSKFPEGIENKLVIPSIKISTLKSMAINCAASSTRVYLNGCAPYVTNPGINHPYWVATVIYRRGRHSKNMKITRLLSPLTPFSSRLT